MRLNVGRSMQITARDREGVVVLDLIGRFTTGVGDVALREAIHEVLASGEEKILVNMSKVKRIDLSFVGELVASVHTVKRRGAFIKLAHLDSRTFDIMMITRLIECCDAFSSEEEALADFA